MRRFAKLWASFHHELSQQHLPYAVSRLLGAAAKKVHSKIYKRKGSSTLLKIKEGCFQNYGLLQARI
jgi:hypothetical protein